MAPTEPASAAAQTRAVAHPRLRLLPRGEKALARLAAAGDERAFAAIFKRYHQEVYRYCYTILGDPHEAQDALQSTMASTVRALPGETREIALRPWLYRVAHNEALNIIRRRRDEVEFEERPEGAGPGADSAAEGRERLRDLVSDLGSLPERQCSALVMRELSGLGYDEIATALGISNGAARQAVYESRTALFELSQGREMSCQEVRELISECDGRRLRGRKVRAHLRACEQCADFKTAITARTTTMRAVVPPLSPLAASGLLAMVLGGGSAKLAAGGLAGLVGGGSAAVGAKSLAALATTAAVGFGVAGASGVVDLPGSGAKKAQPAVERAVGPQPAPPAARPDTAPPQGATGAAAEAPSSRAAAGKQRGAGRGKSHATGAPQRRPGRRGDHVVPGAAGIAVPGTPATPGAPAAPNSAAGGASAAAPAGSGRPETPPGSAVAAERSQGRSATPTTGPPAVKALPPRGQPAWAKPDQARQGLQRQVAPDSP